MRVLILLGAIVTLAACQGGEKPVAEESGPRDKNAPLTETATPNKPASKEAADVETEDLESLKKELNALNSDLSKMRQDLVTSDPTAKMVVPDTSISTPRALVTNGIVDIPDSKIELAQAETAHINGVRVGAHPDKTRLVFDIDGADSRNPDVSVNGNVLKIHVFNAEWPDAETQYSSLEGSFGVFDVARDKDDTVITVALKNPASLKSHSVLPPATPGGPRRLVIDLAPAS